MMLNYTDKQKYKEIKSYCSNKYENEKFEVSYIRLCLEMLFPNCLDYNSDNSIDEAIEGLGSNDLGIDAYLKDDDSKILYICQFKTSLSEKETIRPNDLSYFNNIEDRIYACNGTNHSNKRVVEICEEYKNLISKGYRGEFYFITSYNLSKEPIEKLKHNNYKILTLDDIFDKFRTYRSESSSNDLKECTLELCSSGNGKDIPYYTFELERMGKKKTLVGILNGLSIIDVYKLHRKELFERNVRYFLGNRGINKNMISTAKDHPEIFYYYNNGITITCEKFLKEGNKLKLTKPQIINGAQTVCSIYDAYEERLKVKGWDEVKVKKHFEKLYIMVRIIETTKTDGNFARDVTKYNNTQNKILEQDFYANDRIQQDLKKKLFDFGYFYENKRNEYETLSPEDKKKYSDKLIKLGDITPLYCCYKEQDNSTGSHKKDLFKEERFKEIFSEDCLKEKEVYSIIFVYNIHKILKDIKRQLNEYVKNKEPEAKGYFTLQIREIVTPKYLEIIKDTSKEEKEKAEKIIQEFDAIKQPYVMIAAISEIIKRHNLDIEKYCLDKMFYEIIQKKWLKKIANEIYDDFHKNSSVGDNVINYYKSRDLIRDYKDFLDEQESREDKKVEDLFPVSL